MSYTQNLAQAIGEKRSFKALEKAKKDARIADLISKRELTVGRIAALVGVNVSRVHRVAEQRGLTLLSNSEYLANGGDL